MSRPPGVRFGRESFPEFKGETEQHVASRGFSVDSRLFAKILREGSEKQPLSTRESSTGRREDAESLHSITGQCELRLRGDGERPMVFVIHLARRGRINVIARKEHSSWCVCFAPEQTGTYQWLLAQQSRCQERLACKLGQPVRVHVLREGSG